MAFKKGQKLYGARYVGNPEFWDEVFYVIGPGGEYDYLVHTGGRRPTVFQFDEYELCDKPSWDRS